MNDHKLPQMSVLIVTPDDYQSIRKTIRHLNAQTVRDRLEIIIVAPSREGFGLVESEVAGFQRLHVVEAGEIKLPSEAKVLGALEATAPILAFAEEHCYPEPGWAAALIAGHEQGWAAVGPAIRNGNPRTLLSWAGVFLHFG
jgi:Glycosyl transferase family 2